MGKWDKPGPIKTSRAEYPRLLVLGIDANGSPSLVHGSGHPHVAMQGGSEGFMTSLGAANWNQDWRDPRVTGCVNGWDFLEEVTDIVLFLPEEERRVSVQHRGDVEQVCYRMNNRREARESGML